MSDLWKQYESDLNGMSDAEVESECQDARNDLDAAESWLEAVASWEAAGKPRNRDGEVG